MITDWMPADQRAVSDWLATEEGHRWQDEQVLRTYREHAELPGLTHKPWICLVEGSAASWMSRSNAFWPREYSPQKFCDEVIRLKAA